MHGGNMLSLASWRQIEPRLRAQIADALVAQTALLEEHPDLQSEEREDAEKESLRAQRATLTTLLSNGLISEQVYEELVAEVDAAISQVEETSEKAQQAT
jgi:hypothetical protein